MTALSGRIATEVTACMGRRKRKKAASAASAEKEARRQAELEICLNCPLKECAKDTLSRRGCPLSKKIREEGRRDII